MTALELLESGGWTWVQGKFGASDKKEGCLAGLLVAAWPGRLMEHSQDVRSAIHLLFPERDLNFNDHPDTTEADVRRVLKVAGA